MKDLKSETDARQLSSLAGADATEGQSRAAAAVRRSRRLRLLAIVVVVVGALAIVVWPHFRDDTRLSRITDLAARNAQGDGLPITCPPVPIARDVVKPSSAVELQAAVLCHYPSGPNGIPPVEGRVPASQLARISADMNAHTTSGALSQAPGLAVRTASPENWVVVALTTGGQRVQLLASPYPTVYTWDGLGPGLEWHPSPAVRKALAADLPG